MPTQTVITAGLPIARAVLFLQCGIRRFPCSGDIGAMFSCCRPGSVGQGIRRLRAISGQRLEVSVVVIP